MEKEVECYFGDLQPRVIDYKENHYDLYRTGKVYRYRDNVDGGMENKYDRRIEITKKISKSLK